MRWRNTSSVDDMLDELEWPSLETLSGLVFFYKINPGTVSLDKDKYLTPAPDLRRLRASHETQYTRYLAYSDALKKSFFFRTIPIWKVSSLRWYIITVVLLDFSKAFDKVNHLKLLF